MAVSNQIDFPEFFHGQKMTYRNSSIPEYDYQLSLFPRKIGLRRHVQKINFLEMADCGKSM
jgi:hypothetical protein